MVLRLTCRSENAIHRSTSSHRRFQVAAPPLAVDSAVFFLAMVVGAFFRRVPRSHPRPTSLGRLLQRRANVRMALARTHVGVANPLAPPSIDIFRTSIRNLWRRLDRIARRYRYQVAWSRWTDAHEARRRKEGGKRGDASTCVKHELALARARAFPRLPRVLRRPASSPGARATPGSDGASDHGGCGRMEVAPEMRAGNRNGRVETT